MLLVMIQGQNDLRFIRNINSLQHADCTRTGSIADAHSTTKRAFEFAQRTRTTVQIKFTFDCCLECVDKYFRHSCTDDHVNLTDNATNQD